MNRRSLLSLLSFLGIGAAGTAAATEGGKLTPSATAITEAGLVSRQERTTLYGPQAVADAVYYHQIHVGGFSHYHVIRNEADADKLICNVMRVAETYPCDPRMLAGALNQLIAIKTRCAQIANGYSGWKVPEWPPGELPQHGHWEPIVDYQDERYTGLHLKKAST